jgi:hypothetical protein
LKLLWVRQIPDIAAKNEQQLALLLCVGTSIFIPTANTQTLHILANDEKDFEWLIIPHGQFFEFTQLQNDQYETCHQF